MFRFESAHLLSWLLVSPVILALFYISYLRWSQIAKKNLGGRVSSYLLQSFSIKKAFIKALLLSIALACFILAWARPQMGKGQTEIKSEGVEIMLLVDVSNSMLAEDVKPSRLDHAKKEIMRLLDALGGDKVGMIAFAGSSVLLSPLTTDKAALKMFVESISTESVQTQGTEVGKALTEAREAFKRGGEEGGELSRYTKVVILISDGEDHEKGAEKVAQDLTKEGIRVFAMAFGTEAGGKIPRRDLRGRLRGYLKDDGGEIIVSKVKGDFLRSIAKAGKGSFYHVTFGGDQMISLKEDLDQLEKAEFDSLVSANYDEKYQWILLIGILLALTELIIGTRKKLSAKWNGRFPI